LCAEPDMIGAVQNLWSGTTVSALQAASADFADVTESGILGTLRDRLQSLGEGYMPYVYEYTHPVLKKTGFHVVKCIVPALYPLYLDEHMATIQSVRLQTEPLQGLADVLTKIQTYPHPFP